VGWEADLTSSKAAGAGNILFQGRYWSSALSSRGGLEAFLAPGKDRCSAAGAAGGGVRGLGMQPSRAKQQREEGRFEAEGCCGP
jgi:hypothetical protein